MKVYFVSGLGADSRVFRHIRLPVQFEIIHLDWIRVESAETLEKYAERLAAFIDDSEPYALLGLSMGGMIACEIYRQKKSDPKTLPQFVVLLSSVPVSAHLPYYFKWASSLKLRRFVPVGLLKSASFVNRFFSADNSEDRKVIRQVVQESNVDFIRWAMGAIVNWNNEIVPDKLIQIHGSRDRILPLKFTRPTHVLSGANHLMVMSRARHINEILATELKHL